MEVGLEAQVTRFAAATVSPPPNPSRSTGEAASGGKPTDATVLATARASPTLDATEGRRTSLRQPHQHRHCNFYIARRCLCAASIAERGHAGVVDGNSSERYVSQ